jgi:ribosomal protein S18 acetylase RimI-like enzyme
MTRENAISAADLAARGITAETWARAVATGALPGHVVEERARIVGYCFGRPATGEVVVLALLPAYEERGIGKALLGAMLDDFRGRGVKRAFLETSADPATRAHGFYRHLGWRPTGERVGRGDEILELILGD